MTFLNHVNLWTFCVGVGSSPGCGRWEEEKETGNRKKVQGPELEFGPPERLYPATGLLSALVLPSWYTVLQSTICTDDS